MPEVSLDSVIAVIGPIETYCTKCHAKSHYCAVGCDMAPCKHGEFGLFTHSRSCDGQILHFEKVEKVYEDTLLNRVEDERPVKHKDFVELLKVTKEIASTLKEMRQMQVNTRSGK
jgi:hypothetical protein